MAGWAHACLRSLGLVADQSKSAEEVEAERCLQAEEVSALRQKFDLLAGPRDRIPLDSFLELFELRDLDRVLGVLLFAAVCRGPPGAGAAFIDVLVAKARCAGPSEGEAEAFGFSVLSGGAPGPVSRPQLQAALRALMSWALGLPPGSLNPYGLLRPEAVDALLHRAIPGGEGEERGFTLDDFRVWTEQHAPAVLRTLRALLSGGGAKGLVPELEGLRATGTGLLQPDGAWALAAALPPKQQVQWGLLFSSAAHGHSYNSLLMRVLDAGPTVVLVRDKQGHLFGGFASESWHKNGQFYGNFQSFLFSLRPAAGVHRPSGANANFQWCGANFSQLPNGIGFGGQVNYFGLHLDGTLDTGMSRASATYASPSLSCEPVFEVDMVEVWRVEPPPEVDEAAETAAKKKVNVLDTTQETQHFLGMAGRQMHSAALRD